MFKRLIGILIMGIVIKIMDDSLDRDLDKMTGQWNITSILNRSITPYCILMVIISLYFNFEECISIYMTSYILGMINDCREKLPSKLFAWQECIIIFFLSISITSFINMISTIFIIILIQIIDDYIDLKKDTYPQTNNIIIKLGCVNTILLFIIILFLSLVYFPIKLYYFIIADFFIYLIFFYLEKINRNDLYDY
ncbi:MAG: hypothetical protein ACOC1O_02730 [bacterium]